METDDKLMLSTWFSMIAEIVKIVIFHPFVKVIGLFWEYEIFIKQIITFENLTYAGNKLIHAEFSLCFIAEQFMIPLIIFKD